MRLKAEERERHKQRIRDERESRGYFRCKLTLPAPETTQGRLKGVLSCGMLVFEREFQVHLHRVHDVDTEDPTQHFEAVPMPPGAEVI